MNLEKLVENNWSKKLGGKLVENSPTENSSQEQKIISGKYSPNFVIIPCYEVLNYTCITKYCTVNYKSETISSNYIIKKLYYAEN